MSASRDSRTSAWARGARPVLIALSLVGSSAVGVSVLYLVARAQLPGRHDLIGTGLAPDAGIVLVGIAIVYALWRPILRATTPARVIVWIAAIAGTVTLGRMATVRYDLAEHERTSDELWPPRVEIAERAEVDLLTGLEQGEWGLRLALHAAGTATRLASPPSIPIAWPWPHRVTLAIRSPGERTELWSHVDGTNIVCRAVLHGRGAPDTAWVPKCSDAAVPPGLAFAPATRRAEDAVPEALDIAEANWPQHRRDARRGAAVPSPEVTQAAWRTDLPTPVRAGVSVIAGHVLVGGHATGLVTAIDPATGGIQWQTHVPNWVHHEPVGDGATMVVGFGDNALSFLGRAPSGLAAFDLATGMRRWTVFDESSVMTAPILVDSLVVYATAAGLLKVRSLATGALRRTAALPGGVIMGPPVASGDTVVTALDIDWVCAFLLPDAKRLWCRELPWLRMMGHASPGIEDGTVVVSAVATARSLGLGDLGDVRMGLLPHLARSVLFPNYWELVHAGQIYLALDLATGEPQWRSPFFGRRRAVDGHTAGTPAIEGQVGLIVLPIADTVVAFDVRDGAVRWSSAAHSARGPAVLVDGHAIVAGRDGVIEVRDLASGALRCTIRRETGWDRAGPAIGGSTAYFADLDGGVEAMPLERLLSCDANAPEP